MRDPDRYRGCLIGGAVGDALGYAVEFCTASGIFEKYGEKGITDYDRVDGMALVSDDTQMTLFTANGLLAAQAAGPGTPTAQACLAGIAACYRDWLKTQTAEEFGFAPPEFSWLNHVPEMNHNRAPGLTCLHSLMEKELGSTARPLNSSKGCGGVMRVAPIGLFFGDGRFSPDETDRLGAEAAALTHGHELGYLPAAMLVHIIHRLTHEEDGTVLRAVEHARRAMYRLFPEAVHLGELMGRVDLAMALARRQDMDDRQAIAQLGEGWVAEETLAISLYCSLKYEQDFEKAILASVNHGGDSDSTGAVTGNILGAHLGMKGIPDRFLHNLELKETILEIAEDLFRGGPDGTGGMEERWQWKYGGRFHPVPAGE